MLRELGGGRDDMLSGWGTESSRVLLGWEKELEGDRIGHRES